MALTYQGQPIVNGAQSTPPAQSAPAPSHEALWPYLLALGGQGADVATTIAALQRGGQEQNPLGAMGTLGVKAALTALATYMMHHNAQTGHAGRQKALGIGVGAAGAIPAALNLSQLAK